MTLFAFRLIPYKPCCLYTYTPGTECPEKIKAGSMVPFLTAFMSPL